MPIGGESSVSDKVDTTLPSCTICEDTAVYDFEVDKTCDDEVEKYCLFEDVSNNDCHSILSAEDP